MQKNNFIYSVLISFIFLLVAATYIVVRIYPTDIWTGVLFGCIFFAVSLGVSLLFYAIGRPYGFESGKAYYRRQLRKAVFLGIVVVALLLVQMYFDLV